MADYNFIEIFRTDNIDEFIIQYAKYCEDYPDNPGYPLYLAATHGAYKIVNHLIENGYDVNEKVVENNTALNIACYKGYYEIVKLLLEKGADVNNVTDVGDTPLTITLNNLEIMKLLIKYGADVNHCYEAGKSALVAGLSEIRQDNEPQIDRYACLKLLIENGANVNKISDDGFSILMYALMYKRKKDVISLLIENGADVNFITYKNNHTEYALKYAVYYNDVENVELLLEHGARVDIIDNMGFTILHNCISSPENAKYRIDIVKLLIKYGADPNLKNNNGVTPLEMAIEYMNENNFDNTYEVILFLEKYKERTQILNKLKIYDMLLPYVKEKFIAQEIISNVNEMDFFN